VRLDEAWSIPTEHLLDSSPWQLDGVGQAIMVIIVSSSSSRCRTRIVVVCVTAFKLAHLLKSIIFWTNSRLVMKILKESFRLLVPCLLKEIQIEIKDQ
jgi:hypothetical protein